MAVIKAPPGWKPEGDMGLGLCYLGTRRLAELDMELEQLKEKPRTDGSLPDKRFIPNWAVTFAPWPMNDYAGPLGVPIVALPVCYGCLWGSADQCGGADRPMGTLLVAKGGLPRGRG